jgi:hypothetical protein
MSKHRSTKTKDERYLATLYEMALESGDMETEFHRYEVGVRATLTDKSCDAICKLLIQANFIKKNGDMVYITPHGIKLAEQLV